MVVTLGALETLHTFLGKKIQSLDSRRTKVSTITRESVSFIRRLKQFTSIVKEEEEEESNRVFIVRRHGTSRRKRKVERLLNNKIDLDQYEKLPGKKKGEDKVVVARISEKINAKVVAFYMDRIMMSTIRTRYKISVP